MYSTFIVGTCKRYLVSLDQEVSVDVCAITLELIESNGLVSWVTVNLRRLADVNYDGEPLPHFAMSKIADPPEMTDSIRAMAI